MFSLNLMVWLLSNIDILTNDCWLLWMYWYIQHTCNTPSGHPVGCVAASTEWHNTI